MRSLAGVALVAAATLHLGFQLTVTVLVYPALREVRRDDWTAAHAAHSRRIVPLVALTYVLLAAALVVALVQGPRDGWLAAAGLGALLTVLTTALAAAPLHGRLGRAGPESAVLQRLRRVDLLRLAGALVCAVGAFGWAGLA